MEFTLQQARRLEERLKNLRIEDQFVEVRAYDEDIARKDIDLGVEDLLDEIEYKLYVNKIRYKIKHMINVMNMECGVSNLLCKREGLYEDAKILETLNESWDDTDRQVHYIKDNPDEVRKVSVVRKDIVLDVQGKLEAIRIELIEIKDTLLKLNRSVTITLSDDDAIFLQENDLL